MSALQVGEECKTWKKEAETRYKEYKTGSAGHGVADIVRTEVPTKTVQEEPRRNNNAQLSRIA